MQPVSRTLILIVQLYQWCISPWLGTRCRFEPTCSCYAIDAVKQHGPVSGSFLTIKRLLRCQPFGGHGYDPIPHSHKK